MLKKTFAAVGVAALLLLGGASAASAATPAPYPPTLSCVANPATIATGQTSVVTCTGLQPNISGTFTVTGPGVVPDTLTSIVFAATTGTSSVDKTSSAAGEASVSFRGPAAGSFTISLEAENGQSGSAAVTVTGSGDLPATGGTVPAAAIWLGVGAIGIGGIAVAAAVVRRRSQQNR